MNVTPLTDFVVARALASDPAVAFDGFDATRASVIAAGLTGAKAYVNAQAIAFAGSTQSIDLLTGVFVVGDANDEVLDNFAASLHAAGKSIADLQATSSSGLTVSFANAGAVPVTPVSFAAAGLYSAVAEQANSEFRALLETACGVKGTFLSNRGGSAVGYFGCTQGSSNPATDLLGKMLVGGLPHQIGADIVSGPTNVSPPSATVTFNRGMPGVNVGDSCTAAIDASSMLLSMSVTVAGSPYFPQTDAAAFSFGEPGNDNAIWISSSAVVSQYQMTNSLGNMLLIRPNLELPSLDFFGTISIGAEATVFAPDRASYYVCK